MENSIAICCKIDCPNKFTCAKFGRALDVNSGKIKQGYYIVEKCDYEK